MKRPILFISLVLLVNFSFAQEGQDKSYPKPLAKNIILLIGDGMGTSQVYAGMISKKGALNIERCKHIGFAKTFSEDHFVTDSGASGTAIATGHKTYNGAISVDMDSIPLKTILEHAEAHDKSTGLVATSTITHATPASFISHQASRRDYEDIAMDFMKTDVEVIIGGGLDHFNNRMDSLDLTDSLKSKGYHLVYDMEEMVTHSSGKMAALLYPGSPPKYSEGREIMLPLSTKISIEVLCQDEDGFFLMVEGSQIDWGGHDNDPAYIIDEMLDFDRAVGLALDFAEKDGNTLVIITADHETGGMGVNGGDIHEGTIEAAFTTKDHTGVMVPVFAYGPGAELFQGIYDNTEIFDKMMQAFGFDEY
jgi:alkaline phosphatase